MGDSQLAERVLSLFERSPYVAHRKLRFETHAGEVTLRGVVGSYYQKQMAQEMLRGLEGIQRIENQLEVTWG